ncbi:DUF6882 domain-containing protein [Nocardioides litoris]|uniref:DUF6882 domain-containing protein n=1 Tax=Nocardioides litoris TaxID=1926648 RepID=UPI00112469DE|nr:DUF6882 domain-containing protein [Nocardioides litoris]
MRLPDLQDLSDQAALFSYLHQLRLSEHLDQRLGRWRWDADMEDRRLSFVPEEGPGRINVGFALVASVAPGPRSLIWGWAHPQHADAAVEQLRAHGEQHAIVSLTSPEVALPTEAQGEALHAEVAEVCHVVGQVAVQVTGRSPYYSAPVGGGTRVVLLLKDLEDLGLPGLRIDETVPTRVPAYLASGAVSDHRRALHGLGVHAGWELAWTEDWSSLELRDPVTGNAVVARFDERARFSGLSGRLG